MAFSSRIWLVIPAVVAMSVTATLQDAGTVLADVTRALGAAELKTIQYSGTGFAYSFGQNYRPDAPYPKFHATYSRVIDFDRGLAREEIVRTQFENPPRGGGGQPLYTEARGAAVVTPNSGWGGGALALTPHGFVKAAAGASPTIRSGRIGSRTMTVLAFTARNQYPCRGIRQRPESDRADRHVGSEPDPRRHADSDDVCRLPGVWGRPVPDADHAAAGGLPDAGGHRHGRAASGVREPSGAPTGRGAAAGARRRSARGAGRVVPDRYTRAEQSAGGAP